MNINKGWVVSFSKLEISLHELLFVTFPTNFEKTIIYQKKKYRERGIRLYQREKYRERESEFLQKAKEAFGAHQREN